MRNTYLFIGGPKHGERMTVHEGAAGVSVAVPPHGHGRTFHFGDGTPTPYEPVTFKTETYTRCKVGMRGNLGGARQLAFMRHSSLSESTACEVALDLIFTEAGGTVHG